MVGGGMVGRGDGGERRWQWCNCSEGDTLNEYILLTMTNLVSSRSF